MCACSGPGPVSSLSVTMRPLYGSIASPEGEETEAGANCATSRAHAKAPPPRSCRSASSVSLVRHTKPQGGSVVLGMAWGLFVLASVGVVWKVKGEASGQQCPFSVRQQGS